MEFTSFTSLCHKGGILSVNTRDVDLLSMTQCDVILRRKGATNGGEWAGPCPFCGGKDRFLVWPNHKDGPRWWCRGENRGGDAINYVMLRHDLNFAEALAYLGIQGDSRPRPFRAPRPAPAQRQTYASASKDWLAINDQTWQAQATAFVEHSSELIFDKAQAEQLQYLLKRGFSDTTIGVYWLGYNPADINTRWGDTDVFLPAGWVIPWMFAGTIWRINVRRIEGKEPKYMGPAGNANGLYNAAMIKREKPVVLVEGEFDALAIQQAAGDLVIPVATGSTSGARLQKWIARIAQASAYIVAFDDDAAGQQAANFWLDVLPGSVRLVPKPHDPNDMLKAGGEQSIRDWLSGAI